MRKIENLPAHGERQPGHPDGCSCFACWPPGTYKSRDRAVVAARVSKYRRLGLCRCGRPSDKGVCPDCVRKRTNHMAEGHEVPR